MVRQLLLFSLVVAASASSAEPCLTGTPTCGESIRFGSNSFSLYRSFSLSEINPNLTRLVIVVHGVNRNADEYFEWVMTAVTSAQAAEKTLVVAPHFKNQDDKKSAEELYWKDSKWKTGDDSINSGERVSSFSVVDRVVAHIVSSGYFPKLTDIIVTGHSAGGQLTSRLAVTSSLLEALGPKVTYVIGNPSTYFYVSPLRWEKKSESFVIPEGADCKDYDDYPYGIRDANPYVSKVSQAQMYENLRTRRIVVFVGEKDTETELLDMSCGANLQGKNRYERGVVYHRYLKQFFSPEAASLVIVPKLGHDGGKMYQSAQGKWLLFGGE